MTVGVANIIVLLMLAAWCLPLVGAVFGLLSVSLRWSHRLSVVPGWVSLSAMAASATCSLAALGQWITHRVAGPAGVLPEIWAAGTAADRPALAGQVYEFAAVGRTSLAIDYYIDALALVMCSVVGVIATLVHLYALAYLDNERTEDFVDDESQLATGEPVRRPGRFHIFFGCLSLFCFSMLGLVLSGNLLQTYMFWELVGLCSFLLIGFYLERPVANAAANKAFLMNRVGDCGFLLGIAILWTLTGELRFFAAPAPASEINQPAATVGAEPLAAGPQAAVLTGSLFHRVATLQGEAADRHDGATHGAAEFWLLLAALGVLAGCLAKSAQLPFQTWLPDAMAGPTPVSALVHSATMVAAGVFLIARVYPLFPPPVQWLMAGIGSLTLFIGATQAMQANDLKQVLAYSTVSQLGYMLLGLGTGGWEAGVFHLVTHAFFKSLLFLGAGAVITACHHQQDLRQLGGLWKSMPATAITMLIGVISITGLAVPGTSLAFAGHHSKDAILASSLHFVRDGAGRELGLLGLILFGLLPLVTTVLTGFYMFRLWIMTFLGTPRSAVAGHPEALSWKLLLPLVVLSVPSILAGAGGEDGLLCHCFKQSQPFAWNEPSVSASVEISGAAPGVINPQAQAAMANAAVDAHNQQLSAHRLAGRLGLLSAAIGVLLAWLLYGRQVARAAELPRQFASVHQFIAAGWWFDPLYRLVLVEPVFRLAGMMAWLDRRVLDGITDRLVSMVVAISQWDRLIDERLVDGLVRGVGHVGQGAGLRFAGLQTGRLRQYLLWIAFSVVVMFVTCVAFLPRA